MAVGTGLALLGGALIGGASTIAASNNGKKATAAATKASNDATAANNALQQGIYNDNKATLAPFVQQGGQATGQINALLGSNPFSASTGATFQADPGYEFTRNEGLRGLAQSAAFGGGLRSGGALKSAMDYTTGLASQGYGDWWNRDQAQLANNNNVQGQYLNALTGQQQVGVGAASAQAGVGTSFANSVGQNNFNAAQVQGNAALANAGQQNAMLGNLATTGSNLLGQYAQYSNSSYNPNPPAPIKSWFR